MYLFNLMMCFTKIVLTIYTWNVLEHKMKYLSITLSSANFRSNSNHHLFAKLCFFCQKLQLISVLQLQYLGQFCILGFHSVPSTYGGSPNYFAVYICSIYIIFRFPGLSNDLHEGYSDHTYLQLLLKVIQVQKVEYCFTIH